MKELYLLTILDGVKNILSTLTGVGLFFGVILVAVYMCFRFIENQNIPSIKNWAITLLILGASLGLVNVFVPTTNQGLMIYGIGTVVDYVQTNDDIKQLPDKCVQALNMWADDCLEEQQKEEQQKKANINE